MALKNHITMKNFLLLFAFIFPTIIGTAQNFISDFMSFKESVVDIEYDGLNALYPRPYESYYKGYNLTPDFDDVLYLDSITQKLNLTTDELELLQDNHFFVTERLSYPNFGVAYHDIYSKDLPVFVSTDLILHGLHMSYSLLLKSFERNVMSSNIELVLKGIYDHLPEVYEQYGTEFYSNVQDVDLYVTTAYSLIKDEKQVYRYAEAETVEKVWNGINGLSSAKVPLFTTDDRIRKIDFSQFKVRGHYVYTKMDSLHGLKSLEPYFRTMMWLGRIDFFLSPPPSNPWEAEWTEEEILHMNQSAFILNEMIQQASNISLFRDNERIINYFVGLSDNITIDEYQSVLNDLNITGLSQLSDSATYKTYYDSLTTNDAYTQKIMGGIFLVDPDTTLPGVLPISYRLSGQRFIIDSEVLSNVVFDRIIYKNKKMIRLMPDPLDAMYCLGNSDALSLLEPEVETYKYGRNLANTRYLIDTKDDKFWNASLYNAWLTSIRALNPKENSDKAPFFMQTGAWHQQKLNTQLASYAQLRHDNLLYAKPSYTGGTGCSYPYGYVEPYPEFYATLADFATEVGQFLSTFDIDNWEITMAKNFFPNFSTIMNKLTLIAEKELKDEKLTAEQTDWLNQFLFEGGMSGEPPYNGWISSLFLEPFDIIKQDFITVDLHTQPTDSSAAEVGKVLHIGTGRINQGVFIIDQPATSTPTAYVGAFMSYYKKITKGYNRLTDQGWTDLVEGGELPERPTWAHSYLLNTSGKKQFAEIELPTTMLIESESVFLQQQKNEIQIYPNPVTDVLSIFCNGSKLVKPIRIVDATGKTVLQLNQITPDDAIDVSELKSGIYLLEFENRGARGFQKFLKE